MIVADTNLVVYTVIDGVYTKDAERIRTIDRDWTAPHLLRLELMNVIAKTLTANRITRDGALRTFRRGIKMVNFSKLQADPLFIFNASQTSGCSAFDLEFVWLAMELGVPLVTTDQRLLKAFPGVAVDLATFA